MNKWKEERKLWLETLKREIIHKHIRRAVNEGVKDTPFNLNEPPTSEQLKRNLLYISQSVVEQRLVKVVEDIAKEIVDLYKPAIEESNKQMLLW